MKRRDIFRALIVAPVAAAVPVPAAVKPMGLRPPVGLVRKIVFMVVMGHRTRFVAEFCGVSVETVMCVKTMCAPQIREGRLAMARQVGQLKAYGT